MAYTHDTSHSHDLSVFPERLCGKRILLCTESFGPVNGVSRTTLMLVNHLRAHGVNVAVVAPHNHTKVNTFVPSDTADSRRPTPDSVPGSATALAPAPASAAASLPTTARSSVAYSSPYSSSPFATPWNPEIRVHGYPLPFNPELSVVYPVRLSALYARTFGAPPDLIYLASPASLGFQVMLQLRQQPVERQVPVLANFQTDLAGYCAILFPPPLSDLAVYAFSQVESFLFRHPSIKTVFYPSTFVRRYLEKNGVCPRDSDSSSKDKLRLLRRGVNTDMFHPARRSEALRRRLAPTGTEIILLCVARLGGEKGFEFLAAVAHELDRRGLSFTLLIVGGNRSGAVEAEVKALFSEDLRRRGRVVFAGFQTGAVLAEAYASADLFLHCSITETFGLVVLESMASGVPVIARDEGGPSDTIVHGVSGFLVPPGDLGAFVDKVMLVAAPDSAAAALRARLSTNARRQACDATWEKINNTVAWRMLDAMDEREVKTGVYSRRKQSRRLSSDSAVAGLADADDEKDDEDGDGDFEKPTESTPLLDRLARWRARPSGSAPSASSASEMVMSTAEMDAATAAEKLELPLPWQAWANSLGKGLVDARLAAGLGIILGFWGVVGVYLIFVKTALWLKSRTRWTV